MKHLRYIFSMGMCALWMTGCCYIPPADNCFVSDTVKEKLNKEVLWSICSSLESRQSVELLETADSAVQIALLNNPKIQVLLEEIGIAHADLIEAGLLSNPAFDIIFRYPDRKNLKTNIEYTITQSFIDIILIPLRLKVAKTELHKTTLKVTSEILDLAFEVEQTFYELQSAQQELKYIESLVELSSILSELISRQQNVGNVNNIEHQQVQSKYFEAKLDLAKIQNDIIRLRERLNRLLGFSRDIKWKISENLPEIDYQGLPIESLESVAFRERLDLKAARDEVLRISQMLGIKQWWVYTKGRIGIGGERDPDGTNLIGPAFSGEVPIFNYGQADRMRLLAELRQAQDRLAFLEIQVLSEVREAHNLLMTNSSIINDYRDNFIPLYSKILQSSEELYNVMGLGIDRLLENKRQEFQAYRNHSVSLRNYWIARVQLDRALGGKLYLVLSKNIAECNCEGVLE